MKPSIALVALLVVSAVLAGCTQKDANPTPTTHVTPTATVITSSSPTASSSPTTTAPPPPQQVLKQVFKYGSPNDAAKAFTVASGASKLDVTVYVNYTGAPYNVAAASGQGNPYVEIKDPSGTSTKIEFTGTSGAGLGSSGGVIAGPLAKTISPAAAGTTWTAGISGTGTNVQADVRVVESFT